MFVTVITKACQCGRRE